MGLDEGASSGENTLKVDAVASIFKDDAGGLFRGNKAAQRLNLSTPSDAENELIKVGALKGPEGIFTVLRNPNASGFSWFIVLGLRAIEVCLGPRPSAVPHVSDCDPYAFSLRMLELEATDEIFHMMTEFSNVRVVQKLGLGVLELVCMDSTDWRHEVARKGGCALVADIGERFKDDPELLCSVVTVMAYLSAEDSIELVMVQYKGLVIATRALKVYPWHQELQTRVALALLNLTQCEKHGIEFRNLGGVPLLLAVLRSFRRDVSLTIIYAGIVANLAVDPDNQAQLVKDGIFALMRQAMSLDPSNLVLQVACMKALVHFSSNPDYYMLMEEQMIPAGIGKLMIAHGKDRSIQTYGNYFLGNYSRFHLTSPCAIL